MGHAPEDRVHRVRVSFPALTTLVVAIASAVVLTLGGCASSAGIASRAQPLDATRVGLAADAAPAPALDVDWWRAFGDDQLSALVERALVDAPSLKVAQARLERAQALVGAVAAADGLQVNAKADATRQRFSATGIYPAPLGGSTRTLANAQIGASYEFDFFGRNRAAIEAAVGAQRAAQADVQAARIVLASNVAKTYVQLGRLFEQREVATRSLKQREETLGLIKQRVAGGLDTNVELRQGEGALPESRQQIEQFDEQIALARHALAALVAAPPNSYDALVVPLRSVHALQVPERVPADLLGRRAEIAAARWRVEAATRDVASAKAGFYPNINLSGFFGLSSIGLDQLAKAASRQYGIGPAITLPIFDSGRLRADLQGRTADLDAAIESYNGAVIDAVHDTADQLSSVRSIERQQAQQASAQASAESAYDLALQRYKAGLATYLVVLNAESGVLNQRRLGVDLRARALEVQIGLIRALGGGYVAQDAAEEAARVGAADPAAPTRAQAVAAVGR